MMIALSALTFGSDGPAWLVPTLLGLAGVTLLGRRRLPHASVQAAFITFVTLAAALAIVRWWPTDAGAAQDVARVCGAIAFFWTVWGSVTTARHNPAKRAGREAGLITTLPFIVALLLGVVAAVIQTVVIAMRIIYVTVDLLNGYPFEGDRDYGFTATGLWSLGFVVAACAVTTATMRTRRVATSLLWSLVAFVSWVALLAPAFRTNTSGGHERTGATLLLLAAWTLVLVTVALGDRFAGRTGGSVETGRASTAKASAPPRVDAHGSAFNISAALIAIGVILVACFHLVVPVHLDPFGYRGSALAVTGSTALAAFSCRRLLQRHFSMHMVDASMGLTSLAFCGLATLFLSEAPFNLAQRYPSTFNAMMVGLAASTALWGWLASRWARAATYDPQDVETHRLSRSARRFSFLSASLALVLGSVMAVWPRLPGIAAMDHSLGRVTAGVAANLFLLVVMLWCSRRLNSPAFHLLTLLTVLSAAGFLAMRIMPFSGSFV